MTTAVPESLLVKIDDREGAPSYKCYHNSKAWQSEETINSGEEAVRAHVMGDSLKFPRDRRGLLTEL